MFYNSIYPHMYWEIVVLSMKKVKHFYIYYSRVDFIIAVALSLLLDPAWLFLDWL